MSIKSLRRFVPKLQEALGEYWGTRVFTAAECRDTLRFDPPCAYLEVSCTLGSLYITGDGEVYLDGRSYLLDTPPFDISFDDEGIKTILDRLHKTPEG